MLGIKKTDPSGVQKELELVKNQLSTLLLHTPTPTLLLDAHYNATDFNEPAVRLFKEYFGWNLLRGLTCGYPIEELIDQALHGGQTRPQYLDWLDVNGNRIQMQVSCTPLMDEEGQLQSIYLTIQNKTESTQDPEVKKLQAMVDAVYQTADVGIALVDENGYYIKTNDGYTDLFGYEKGELDGQHYSIVIPPEDLQNSLKKFKTLLTGKVSDNERICKKKNGEYFTVFRTSKLLQNADGSKFLVVTTRDISETRRYQQIISNTEKVNQLASWEMDVATMKITCSAEMYNILEIAEAEFLNYSYEDLLGKFYEKDNILLVESAITAAIQKGKPFNLEIPINTGELGRKWLSITCTPERYKSQTVKLEGTVQDITKRKSNEFDLERLSLVASKTSNAVFITDKNGLTIWLNESVQKITGYDISEFLGLKPGEILQGKETDQATIRRIRKAIKSRKQVSEIILNYKKDGTPFWINMDIVPVFNNGNIENFIGIGADITEIVKARESQKIKENLEQQQKLFSAIANNFPDGIIGLLDKKLEYIFAGGTEIKKLGLTVSDFIGKKIFDHLVTGNTETTARLKRVLAGENIAFEVTLNGETYSVNAVPARLSEKDEKLILVVLHNITLHKKAEFELMETLKKEKELGELKTRFVSMASHEFRTPLSTVLSSAYLIEKYAGSEEQHNRQKHLRRIVSSVEMLTGILEDFLNLGKIEEGKIQVRLSSFNISNLIAVTISEMKYSLRPKQQIIYWHHGEKEVYMDQSLMKPILMNLISNASKFSPEGSQIEINTFQDESLLILSVKDQGIGISKLDQQHLMERFFRGANAGNIQGTGLGLHIISKYAELMHGNVVCNSELETGTTFTITFYTKLNQDEENPAH